MQQLKHSMTGFALHQMDHSKNCFPFLILQLAAMALRASLMVVMVVKYQPHSLGLRELVWLLVVHTVKDNTVTITPCQCVLITLQ